MIGVRYYFTATFCALHPGIDGRCAATALRKALQVLFSIRMLGGLVRLPEMRMAALNVRKFTFVFDRNMREIFHMEQNNTLMNEK
jgi:hypothetical protein